MMEVEKEGKERKCRRKEGGEVRGKKNVLKGRRGK
jgi:hypothetical protein